MRLAASLDPLALKSVGPFVCLSGSMESMPQGLKPSSILYALIPGMNPRPTARIPRPIAQIPGLPPDEFFSGPFYGTTRSKNSY
jgi:hypothetical protein